MSTQTDYIYGIGFQIKIKPDRLQKFLQDHKESIEQIKGAKSVLECLNLDENAFEDAFHGFEYWPNNGFGDSLTAIIADIMSVGNRTPHRLLSTHRKRRSRVHSLRASLFMGNER